MLQNAYCLAKIGADTAENDRNFAENLPKIGNNPTGPLPGGAASVEEKAWSLVSSDKPAPRKPSLLGPLRYCVAYYVFSNFCSNFWLIFGKL